MGKVEHDTLAGVNGTLTLKVVLRMSVGSVVCNHRCWTVGENSVVE
jgi:hypothetical protein